MSFDQPIDEVAKIAAVAELELALEALNKGLWGKSRGHMRKAGLAITPSIEREAGKSRAWVKYQNHQDQFRLPVDQEKFEAEYAAGEWR